MERLLTSTRHRVVLYDELRGLMILSMLVYHLCYDLAELVELPGMGWFDSAAADVWQLSICGTFLLISGACCTFSRSNLRRGLRLLGLGILLTVVTALFVPDQLIVFGLLHFLGVAVLLTTLLKPLLERIPTVGGIVGMLVLFLLTDHLYDGWFGLTPQLSIALPDCLYRSNWLCFLGFYGPDFFSSDYFPLLPYLFLFWAGVLFSRVQLPAWCYRSHCPPLALLGRNTLWIYLLHQPVLYAILWLIYRF